MPIDNAKAGIIGFSALRLRNPLRCKTMIAINGMNDICHCGQTCIGLHLLQQYPFNFSF